MADHLDQILFDFLRLQHISVAKSFLTKQLSSHPEPNSLLCITDTLDELGIDYSAIKVDRRQLPEVPLPFLAHIRRNNGQFVLVREINENWISTWTGVILAVEGNITIRNKDNTRMLRQERRNRTLTAAFICSAVAFLISPMLPDFNNRIFISSVLSLLGLALTILILQKEAGVHNPLIDRLCHTESTADCNTVLQSHASNLPGWIKLSDIGMIYFTGQLIVLLSFITYRSPTQIIGIFSVLAACSLPLTFFSLYYQGVVLKKWCILCLSVAAVLWLQFLVLFPGLTSLSQTTIEPRTAIMLLLAFAGTTTGWLLLRQSILGKADLQRQLFRAWRLHRDPEVFTHLLQGGRQIDDTPFPEDIQLGAPESSIQLLAVLNPYCKPCATEYLQLEDLLTHNSDPISLTIRFTVATNRKDPRTDAVRYLLQYYRSTETRRTAKDAPTAWRELLHTWFSLMNLDSFEALHPLETHPDIEQLLHLHANWTSANKIHSTPSLFLNGYELPRQYSVADLARMQHGATLTRLSN